MSRLAQVLQNKGDNYILPFFWQHGEDEAVLREYMKAIQDANIHAVCVESRPHPDFCGPKWWQDMDVILDEAQKRNMKVWILDDSHFPTGFANGAVADAPKELHHWYMCARTLEMDGPVSQLEFSLDTYMRPVPPPPWIPAPPPSDDKFEDDKLLKILACPVEKDGALGEAIDLTDCVEDGRVVFDLPEGYFKIYVIRLTRNADGRNNYINFMDKESCKLLLDAVYEPHWDHYKDLFGSVILGFFSDEPPIGNVSGYQPMGPVGTPGQALPWSGAAYEGFTAEYGSEDWLNSLPYLWAPASDSGEQAKVRNAYMEMVSKLVAECFSATNGQWCEAHGVEYIGHQLEDCDMSTAMGASMGHFFRGLSGQHMAGIDNIGGQVLIAGHDAPRHDQSACADEAGFYMYEIAKLGASHAAIDPKKKGRTMCENFGAYGWSSGPREQKFMMDHYMVRGVNRYVPHAFSPKAFPDFDCPPHFYAHGENPVYRHFGDLMAYSNRVCHLIDGGKPVPDVALLYNAESVWAGGSTSNIAAARYLSRAQVDFHIIPADVFEGEDDLQPAYLKAEAAKLGAPARQASYPMSFDGKALTVNGISYQVLVISGCDYVGKAVAAFISKAVVSGYKIVFTDKKPIGIAGAGEMENAAFANALASCFCVPVYDIGNYLRNLASNSRSGNMDKGLELSAIISPANELITTYHYVLDGRDEYLILNEMSGSQYRGNAILKAKGIPVRYYPWDNRLEKVICEQLDAETVEVDLVIDPLELCILVFVADDAELAELNTICPLNEGRFANGGDYEMPKSFEQGMEITSFTVGRVEAKDYLAQLSAAGASLHGAGALVKAPADTLETIYAPFKGMQRSYPGFSGYYFYETETVLTPGCEYNLEFDEVYETAEAFLNGTSLGVRIQKPYRFAIPADLVKENNTLRIEAANLLDRKTIAMGMPGFTMAAPRPLTAAGIVGSVVIKKK